ncbi:MAG: hypothetical protein AB7H80_03740 [Candidatus Kapaibacterium sp.]
MNFLRTALLSSLMLIGVVLSADAYTINSQYGNLTNCDTMTRGIFIVWWEKGDKLSADVNALLDTMLSVREDCLNEYGMADPPNPGKGFYYNVYVYHNGGIFPDTWGNGQGTDANRLPYLTLPNGAHRNWVNVYHETFHIFQYSANSPGFGYSGDSQWYIEATANWYAAVRDPSARSIFVEAESLVRLPQVALWLSYGNFPSDYPENWQRYVHQYALSLLTYYLTEEAGVSGATIVGGFFSGTSQLPQEYLYNQIGGDTFTGYFVDWVSRMVNRFDFLDSIHVAVNEKEWNDNADSTDDYQFIRTYEDSGSGGWFRPAAEEVTRAWAFNTYRLFNKSDDTYTFQIQGDQKGSKGIVARFRGKVLVQGGDGVTFHDVPMTDNWSGELSINLTPADTTVYFIVASVPEYFRDVNQTFGYQMRVVKGEIVDTSLSVPNSLNLNLLSRTVVARFDLLGREVTADYAGLQIIRYSDGSVEKMIGPVK